MMPTILERINLKVRTVIQEKYNGIYNKRLRKRLKNDDFSIICSNCIGGTICHRLGKQFLSPTVNLWMNQKEFLKFVFHLKEYLAYDLVFIDSEYTYPVALLGDVKIYFNHAKTKEQAADDWNRRKTRVNYENLFVIMYERDGITKEDILKLKELPCRNKIVLSDKPHPDIDYVLTIKPNDKPYGQQYQDRNFLGIRTYEKHFDFVEWLNVES